MKPSASVITGWDKPEDLLEGMDAVIFDCDGTLADTMPMHYGAWLAALSQFGIAFSKREFYSFAGMSAAMIVNTLCASQRIAPCPSVESVLAAKDVARTSGTLMSAVTAIAPVRGVLQAARARGMRVAVASGSELREVLESLAAAGVVREATTEAAREVFDAVVTAEDYAKGKPDPEPFLVAAERLGVRPERCVGLEDAELGMQALLSAGMRAVDVRWQDGYPLPDELRDLLQEKKGLQLA